MRTIRYTSFILALIAVVIWTLAAAAAQEQSPEKPATVSDQYKAVLKEFQSAAAALWQATTLEETNQIVARVDKATTKCLELVEKNPTDPIALDALTQIVTQEYWLNTHTSHPGWGKESRQARAIALLLRDHVESDKLAETCKRVAYSFRQECETFLRTVLEKNPHREVQGTACLRLAQFLVNRMDRLDLIANQPELAKRYDTLYGKDYMDALKQQDRAKVMKEAETLYERTIEKYSDVKVPQYDSTTGEQAKTELFEVRHLSVGKEAPGMEGVDQDGKQFKLSDYRGKVVLVYFWSEF